MILRDVLLTRRSACGKKQPARGDHVPSTCANRSSRAPPPRSHYRGPESRTLQFCKLLALDLIAGRWRGLSGWQTQPRPALSEACPETPRLLDWKGVEGIKDVSPSERQLWRGRVLAVAADAMAEAVLAEALVSESAIDEIVDAVFTGEEVRGFVEEKRRVGTGTKSVDEALGDGLGRGVIGVYSESGWGLDVSSTDVLSASFVCFVFAVKSITDQNSSRSIF
jgi:hypothetical protein